MRTIFQALLITIIVITFLGGIGEKKDKDLRNNMIVLCVVSIVAYVVFTWFV